MFNPIIIAALLVQTFVANFSRTAGALLGYATTTGILIWGLGLYDHGQQIAFFGAPLSQAMFISLCVFWYCHDTKMFWAALNSDPDPAKLRATPPPVARPATVMPVATSEVPAQVAQAEASVPPAFAGHNTSPCVPA